ncbi:MAG: type I pullulanase [Oscillospiraceae bacterium]|nr:type I pullulanase [Oscillospiraceae bacterium]
MYMTNTKQIFDSSEFQKHFHCNVPLGAFRSPRHTEFRLWAPTAERARLRLYPAGDGGEPAEVHALRFAGRGLWIWETDRDLDGTYYDYEVTVEGVSRVTADPYARACGLNGERSMVIDLSRTDPPGWAFDGPPAPRPETVIYEIHTKDFSWDPASGVPEAYRGKFKALCLEDTTLDNDGEHPTCLNYLRRLGVTHVQLMPVYDYGSVDEAGAPDAFNWGYDPVNYNVPEGSYSTDPRRGEVRIRELKEAVQALHQNGFRVIMDVVYNHTYHLDSWLWRTAPWYYSRQEADGSPSNGSGCGNDAASERSMCAKYILDSVLYWAEEYHMDGFRFDLMGLLDVELMEHIRRELDERWGKGEKLLFGEPWSASGTAARPGTLLADKGGLAYLDLETGAFCDATRDAVKGSVEKAGKPGFVNGGGLDAKTLVNCVRGWVNGEGKFSVRAPSQTITYLSSHDDWTLWDKLVLTMDPDRDFDRLDPALLRANRLAAAICFTCQGRLFLLGGEEFARTKQGIRDSVRSPLAVNRLDWRRAWENRELADYYRGLIALRMQLPGLQDKSAAAGERIRCAPEPAKDCAALEVDNGEGRWRRLFLAYSAGEETVSLSLPEGEWELLADGESSFWWRDPPVCSGTVPLPPVSAAIFGQR